MGMSRRSLLAGVGAAGGLWAMPDLTAPAVANADPIGLALPGVRAAGLEAAVNVTLTPGLTYSIQDSSEWSAQSPASRLFTVNGSQPAPAPGNVLFMPIRLPVGAILTEVTLPYISTAPTAPHVQVHRLDIGKAYQQVGFADLLTGVPGVHTAAVALANEPKTDGSQSYMTLVGFTDAAQFVQTVRIGYLAPPAAFVANTVVPRVLDTRVTGGKLNANEERVVPTGVPGFAAATALNLTVTETENAGFVAVFAGNVAWPGNSSINWSASGQNVANGVVTAVDPSGQVKIRGGINPTHVVIDVQGYFL